MEQKKKNKTTHGIKKPTKNVTKGNQIYSDNSPEINIPDVIIRLNGKGEHLFVSDNFFTFFDLPNTDIIGKSLAEIGYLKDINLEIEHALNNVVKSGTQFYDEFSIFKGNKLFWFSISLTPEKINNENIQTVLGVFRDINYQKSIEEELNEDKQRYQLATEASDNGVWDWIVDSDEIYYSRKWKAQLGYYPDELDDKFITWMNLLHHEDYNRVKRELENFLSSTSLVFESEYRMRHKDGTYHWFKNRSAVIRNIEGKAIRMFGANRDITEEKKHHEKLMMLQQAFIQSPAPIMITDLEGYIEFFNPAFCKITGFTGDEIIGKKPEILKSGYHNSAFYKNLWDTILAGNEWRGEFKNKRKNGKMYWELASISCLRNEKGIITHYLKISEEITSIKKLQEDLKKARRVSEAANLYKNNFLANMSHEIRTPINGIIGFSELLKYGDLTINQQLHYIDIIEENSRSLLNLIDDIIDISKIEANELKIKKEACSLAAVFSELKELFESLKVSHNKDNLEIRFRIPRIKHHDFIFTDPYRLKQILSNLFLNALKFTNKGFIEVGYQISSENKLQFYVEDSGVGIPANKQKTIFKRFIQNDNNLKPKDAGAGLGLYISQGLVKLLGGTIGVKSQEQKGALFFFTIPYDKIKAPIKSPGLKEDKNYDFSKYTILVAEDIDYNFEYLNEILKKTQANVLWAKDGIDTINMFNNNQVDLILMDIQLPEINGYEATKTIRKSNTTIPIIAQTAYAMSEEKRKCLDSGCDDVLIKPLKIEEVLKTLSRYLK
ncbi:PAS domain S-box protein [Sunxiuqinia sp. A32]|uniref:PAS domain S-box protein n=1 Tax=Sunxiuqinia sp. A32 TaxID=3461496 RepID=UPI0040454EEC